MMNDFTTNTIDIDTNGGYTYEQVMNNKNCSKEPIYWYVIKKTEFADSPRYLFKSNVAESWEFWDKDIINPVRNTNQIYLKFKDVTSFIEPSNEFRKEKTYCLFIPDTSGWNKYWDNLEDKIENGFEVEGVRITGRYFFVINFGRFRAIPVDEYGHQISKYRIWTFLRFLDHQYYMMNELEESLLEGPYKTWEKYHKWFPLKTRMDYDLLKLQSFISSKGRRKGWTATIALGIFNYNFTFVESSMNILAAYEKSHYGPMLDAIHTTKSFLDSHTPWIRRTEVKGSRDHFKSSISITKDFGQKVEEGYLSEIQAISFMDNPFKGIGQGVNVINVEEAGKFNNLLTAFQVSVEPLIRDGEIMIGIAIVAGTAGDMEGGGSHGLAEMMSKPESYAFKSYDNIYEAQDTGSKSGWFIDDMWYSPIRVLKTEILEINDSDKTQVLLDKFQEDYIDCVDEQGNSYRYFSELILDRKREQRKKMSSVAYQKFITQQPKYLSEAFLLNESSPFDTATAREALGQLAVEKIGPKYGIFSILEGKPKFRISMDLNPVDEFPYKGLDTTGCWVLYEDPIKINDEIPLWRYVSGCLTPGEKVMTNKGLMSVEEITYEDKLINEKGELVVIKKLLTYNKIDEDVYTIKMANTFRTTTFTKEHPILISNSNIKRNYKKKHAFHLEGKLYHDFNFNYTTVDKVTEKDWVKLPNVYIKKNDFDIATLWNDDEFRVDRLINNPLYKEDFWWLVGLWLGDGWCNKNSYNINISFNKLEHDYIDKFCNVVETLFDRKVYLRDRNNGSIEATFSFQQLNLFLSKHFNAYALSKNIPEWTKRIDNNLKLNLILGYLDSDGCVTKNKKYYSIEFVSINLELLEGFQDILFSLGIVSGITKLRNSGIKVINKRICSIKETYHLRIANADSFKLSKLINKPNLKLDKITLSDVITREVKSSCFFSDDLEYIYLKIRNITKSSYTGKVYNFECNTHTFMCHHITTHNCDPIDWGSEEVSKEGLHSFAASYIIDTVTRNIVAEYVGRPKKAEDYFEQLWRGLDYYNSLLLYENNLKALFSYFKSKNKLYLLANEPESLTNRWGYKVSNRTKGFHATAAANSYARELIHTWSLENVPMNQDDEGQIIYVPRMYFIKSKGLLQEIISYNSKGNFDRISGLGAAMILLFDRTFDAEDFQNKESFMDKGIFEKVRTMIYKKNNKFNFVNNGN